MEYFDHLEDGRAEGVAFEYALVDATNDEIPELLVRASGPAEQWNGVSEVMAFSVSDDGDELIVPSVWLNEGVAGTGGFRGTVFASSYGDGLLVARRPRGPARGLYGAIHGMARFVPSASCARRRWATILW